MYKKILRQHVDAVGIILLVFILLAILIVAASCVAIALLPLYILYLCFIAAKAIWNLGW